MISGLEAKIELLEQKLTENKESDRKSAIEALRGSMGGHVQTANMLNDSGSLDKPDSPLFPVKSSPVGRRFSSSVKNGLMEKFGRLLEFSNDVGVKNISMQVDEWLELVDRM